MSELKKLAVSGRGATSGPCRSELLVGEGVDPDLRLHVRGLTLSICDSWTLVLTCIFEMSGRLKIFCRSRTVAPSSICGVLLPNARVGSLA